MKEIAIPKSSPISSRPTALTKRTFDRAFAALKDAGKESFEFIIEDNSVRFIVGGDTKQKDIASRIEGVK